MKKALSLAPPAPGLCFPTCNQHGVPLLLLVINSIFGPLLLLVINSFTICFSGETFCDATCHCLRYSLPGKNTAVSVNSSGDTTAITGHLG